MIFGLVWRRNGGGLKVRIKSPKIVWFENELGWIYHLFTVNRSNCDEWVPWGYRHHHIQVEDFRPIYLGDVCGENCFELRFLQTKRGHEELEPEIIHFISNLELYLSIFYLQSNVYNFHIVHREQIWHPWPWRKELANGWLCTFVWRFGRCETVHRVIGWNLGLYPKLKLVYID